MNCSAIFKTNPTDRGMCCTFNALAAEKIYQESKFSEAVAKLQKQNVLDSFEHPVKLPDGFDTGSEPSPEIGQYCLVVHVIIRQNISQGRIEA